MFNIVTEKKFSQIFSEKIGEEYERAFSVFQNYGKNLSYDVANVLLHAIGQKKVNEVLQELEKHYKEHLYSQLPEIRGTVEDRLLGVNKTVVNKDVFLGHFFK